MSREARTSETTKRTRPDRDANVRTTCQNRQRRSSSSRRSGARIIIKPHTPSTLSPEPFTARATRARPRGETSSARPRRPGSSVASSHDANVASISSPHSCAAPTRANARNVRRRRAVALPIPPSALFGLVVRRARRSNDALEAAQRTPRVELAVEHEERPRGDQRHRPRAVERVRQPRRDPRVREPSRLRRHDFGCVFAYRALLSPRPPRRRYYSVSAGILRLSLSRARYLLGLPHHALGLLEERRGKARDARRVQTVFERPPEILRADHRRAPAGDHLRRRRRREPTVHAPQRNPRHREPTGVRRRKPNAEFVVVFGAASTIVFGGVASNVVRRRRRGAPPSDETKRPEDVPRAVEEKRPRRARVPAGVGL